MLIVINFYCLTILFVNKNITFIDINHPIMILFNENVLI
jgi:hypothetical protein